MLNAYFGIVNESVREAGGMINKFGGDSTMAIFGAPVSLDPSESAYRALRAALSIRIRIKESSARRVQAGQKPINIGIGINTGEVITGNVGAAERFEYTVIGDTVNVAARIQGLSSQYPDSNILISEGTYQAFAERDRLRVTDQGAVIVKGRTESVHIYNVIGMRLANTPATHGDSESEVPQRDALEAVYLYCRGFDQTTIAITKNQSIEVVEAWIKSAAMHFEQSKRELGLEFHLTDPELQRLADAHLNEALMTQPLELESRTL
jgi:class 3 adenylate cyclase